MAELACVYLFPAHLFPDHVYDGVDLAARTHSLELLASGKWTLPVTVSRELNLQGCHCKRVSQVTVVNDDT